MAYHPQTDEAIGLAEKGDWSLLCSIFGWQYITGLRSAMKDAEVFAYLKRAH